MGGSLTKTPLERRNTVIRRSQRKSIHQLRSKIINIMKDIKKFNGVNIDDDNYQQLHDRIEQVRRELEIKRKDLQPQLRNIYNETNKKLEECSAYLDDKLEENQQQVNKESKREDRRSVIVEEVEEEENEEATPDHVGHEEAEKLEQSTDKRRTVELHVVQIEPQQQQHQEQQEKETKRRSIMKVGIPVLPGAIMNSLFKKAINQEDILADTRKELETIEFEISNFVGQKNGTLYNKIQQQLDDCRKRIDFDTNDPTIREQIKLCTNYINSCSTFLDEKAIMFDNQHDNNNRNNKGGGGGDGEDVVDEVFESNRASIENLSPKITKTTFV